MKINRTIKALFFLSLSYIFVLTVAFSTFLQIPVFKGQDLMWQSLIEQFITWTPLLFLHYFLFRGITENPKLQKPIIKEEKLFVPGIFLIFFSGFSAGIHSFSQVIEDILKDSKNTFLYALSYFFDEYIGHLLLIFLPIIGFFLILLECNRKKKKLSRLDNSLLFILGLVNGVFWGIIGVEGGSMYIVIIPLVLGFVFYLRKTIKRHRLNIDELPYTKYFLVSSAAMIVTTIIWIFRNGFFTQPDDLGIELFNF